MNTVIAQNRCKRINLSIPWCSTHLLPTVTPTTRRFSKRPDLKSPPSPRQIPGASRSHTHAQIPSIPTHRWSFKRSGLA
ncbi:hypothetical protein B0H34DRAFT_692219 [Crassisporium funariophilum]|nr:hypothetical protein B0H34DRAFT_692219 [Crassisporium funariophilum]